MPGDDSHEPRAHTPSQPAHSHKLAYRHNGLMTDVCVCVYVYVSTALRKRVRKAVGATKASLTHSTSGQLGVSVDLEGQQKGQG